MKPIILKCEVVEDKGVRTFTNKAGEVISYRNCLVRVDGTVIRLKTKPEVDLTPHVGKDVSIELVLKAGENLAATVQGVALVK